MGEAGLQNVGDLQEYDDDRRVLVGSFARQLKQFAIGVVERPEDSARLTEGAGG